MKIQIATILATAAAALLVPSIAHAEERKGWAAADFELLPSGSIEANFVGGNTTTVSTDTAYGIGIVAENELNPMVTVGLAPRYIFNVIDKNSNGDAAKELDLRARVTAGAMLIPKLRVYGFAEPGYSIIFLPDTVRINNETVHPNGFVIGAGGGARFALSSSLSAVFELGYQWGFQSWSWTGTVLGTQVTVNGDDKVNYLQLGFGLAAAVD